MAVSETMKLRTGADMPRIFLGTWKIPLEKTRAIVNTGIRAGYRAIDTANDYGNEHEVGLAIQDCIKEGLVKREDLFIMGKLWNSNHRAEHVRPDLEATLKDLQVDYLDSYIIHWPQAVPSVGKKAVVRTDGASIKHYSEGTMFSVDDKGFFCSDKKSHYIETWHTMEKIMDEGLVKSIGLSNFNQRQVREIIQKAIKHQPAVIQNESHLFLQQKDFRDFCRINNIVFQAYSSLGAADRLWKGIDGFHGGLPSTGHELLQNPMLKGLANKYGKSTAQIALRWHLQMGGSAVCKSATVGRVEDNYKIWDFELTDVDMKALSELNIGWRHCVVPEFFDHPDYPFKDSLPHDYVLGKHFRVSTNKAT